MSDDTIIPAGLEICNYYTGVQWISPPLQAQLSQFLIQVTIIVIIVRLLGRALTKINQPMVIGEIIAGILLGPSAFGQIPGFSACVFTPPGYAKIYNPSGTHYKYEQTDGSITYLTLFANIGLIFFMFFLGMEVEPRLMKKTWRTSLPTAIAAIAVPFCCGIGLGYWLLDVNKSDFDGPATPPVDMAFYLFFGTSISFTAFPVLARILTSARLITSPLGIETLATAAIDDLLAWCTLATVLSYASGGSGINGLYVVLTAIAFILLLIFPVRIALSNWHNRLIEQDDELNRNFIAALFLGLTLCSWFTNMIGIEAFFGAFVFGMIVPKSGNLINDFAPKIELLVVEFFLPIYFAKSGIATDITKLNTGELWGMTIAITVVSFAAKTTPATVLSRAFSKGTKPWKHCLAMGFLMDTRGLVALIVMNIGLSLGILGVKIFTMLVIMCLVTTFLSPPATYYLYQREYHIEQAAKLALQQKNDLDLIEVNVDLHDTDNVDIQSIKRQQSNGHTTALNIPSVRNTFRNKRTSSRWHIGIEAALNELPDHHIDVHDAYVGDVHVPPTLSRQVSGRSNSAVHSPLTTNALNSDLENDEPSVLKLNAPTSVRGGTYVIGFSSPHNTLTHRNTPKSRIKEESQEEHEPST